MSDTALSILMLAAIVLVIGAIALWRRGGARLQIALMLVLAVILAANVAIWVTPTSNGRTLAEAQH
jgi:Na+/glutamate symporter